MTLDELQDKLNDLNLSDEDILDYLYLDTDHFDTDPAAAEKKKNQRLYLFIAVVILAYLIYRRLFKK